MKQITLEEIQDQHYIWINSEHSCGYDRCLLDWSSGKVKQETNWIDHVSIEDFLKGQDYFYLKQSDARMGSNKHRLFSGFKINDVVLVLSEEFRNHSDERIQEIDRKRVKLIHYLEDDGFYITDCFVPDMMEECSDWTHYGFVKVAKKDIVKIEEVK